MPRRPQTEPGPWTERGPPAPDRRRWLVALLVGGFLLNLGWRLWIARQLFAPIVFGDESRYLMFARVLSGGRGGYQQ